METDSGFITSGGFSASIIESHFSNSEVDLQQNPYFSKADCIAK